jgi:phage FluMu protein Com
MAILLRCSGCNASLKVKDELAGRKIKCPKCAVVVAVAAPAATHPESEPPAPRPASATAARRAVADQVNDDASSEGPERRSKKPDAAKRRKASPIVSLPQIVIRKKSGLRNFFNNDYEILDPETDEPLGYAHLRSQNVLEGITCYFNPNNKSPDWYDIRETRESAPALMVRIKRTYNLFMFKWRVVRVHYSVLADEDTEIGTFVVELEQGWKALLGRVNMCLVDADGEALGKVVVEAGRGAQPPCIKLVSKDGEDWGTVVYREAADAWAKIQELKKSGRKFGFVGSSTGPTGMKVSVARQRQGDENMHRLIAGLGLIVEVCGIGKSQTGSSE